MRILLFALSVAAASLAAVSTADAALVADSIPVSAGLIGNSATLPDMPPLPEMQQPAMDLLALPASLCDSDTLAASPLSVQSDVGTSAVDLHDIEQADSGLDVEPPLSAAFPEVMPQSAMPLLGIDTAGQVASSSESEDLESQVCIGLPEPASLAIWSLIGFTWLGLGMRVWRRQHKPGVVPGEVDNVPVAEGAPVAGRTPWSEQDRIAIRNIIEHGRMRAR